MEEESTKPLKKQRQELPPVHDRVRARLERLGITQAELALKLERSQANISKALIGKNKQFLAKIVDYLVERHGDKRSSYYESVAEIIADEMENLRKVGKALNEIDIRKIGGLLEQINEKMNALNTKIKEVQESQEITNDEIKDIQKKLNQRKIR